jgi:hypothetical protein
MMDVTELPFNRFVGVQKCTDRANGIFQLPGLSQYLNHLGTVHASALFALAEASSGQFLAQHLVLDPNTIIPVLRRGDIKYRKPAMGVVYSKGTFEPDDWDHFHETFDRKRRALISFGIEILNQDDVTVALASYEWFIAERKDH